MTTPVLSIVIPTFNRVRLLKVLMQTLVRDLSPWPADVELIVVDNASEDGTQDMVLDFAAQGVPVQLVRNPENIGMDRNLAACFALARGKYFWQLGDDDLPFQGAVNHILSLCRSRDFGILHLASTSFTDGNQDQIFATRMVDAPGLLSLDSRALFRSANVFLTFISANVINRRAVVERIPGFDSQAEINTWLPQLAWILGVLRVVDAHLVIPQPVFGALTGNTGGYRLVEVFGRNLSRITERQLAAAMPSAPRIMCNASLTRVLAGELWALRNRSAQFNQFADEDLLGSLQAVFGGYFYYRVLVLPMLTGPRPLSLVFHLCLRVLNRLNRQFGYRLL